MTYLPDTNRCIKYLNGTSENIKRRLESKQPQDIVVCSIVKAELFYDAQKSVKSTENLEKVHKFLDRFVICLKEEIIYAILFNFYLCNDICFV